MWSCIFVKRLFYTIAKWNTAIWLVNFFLKNIFDITRWKQQLPGIKPRTPGLSRQRSCQESNPGRLAWAASVVARNQTQDAWLEPPVYQTITNPLQVCFTSLIWRGQKFSEPYWFNSKSSTGSCIKCNTYSMNIRLKIWNLSIFSSSWNTF